MSDGLVITCTVIKNMRKKSQKHNCKNICVDASIFPSAWKWQGEINIIASLSLLFFKSSVSEKENNISSVIRQKGESHGGNKKTKHAKFSKRTNTCYSLICTQQGRAGGGGIHLFAFLLTISKNNLENNGKITMQ